MDRITKLLSVNLFTSSTEFYEFFVDNDIFTKIYNNLEWIDYYKKYDAVDGFFQEEDDIPNKEYYLPYLINYLENRCATVYYISVNQEVPLDKLFVQHTQYEGHKTSAKYTGYYVTEDTFEKNECDLLNRYRWSLQEFNYHSTQMQEMHEKMERDMDYYISQYTINSEVLEHASTNFLFRLISNLSTYDTKKIVNDEIFWKLNRISYVNLSYPDKYLYFLDTETPEVEEYSIDELEVLDFDSV